MDSFDFEVRLRLRQLHEPKSNAAEEGKYGNLREAEMYISSVAILVQAGFHQEGRISEEAARRIQDYDDEDESRRARDEAVAAASVGGGGLHDAHVATAEKNHTRDENQHGGSYTCDICQMGVQLSNKEGHENDKPQ